MLSFRRTRSGLFAVLAAAVGAQAAPAATFYLYGTSLSNSSVNGWNRETNIIGQPCDTTCANCCYRDAPSPGYIQCSAYVTAGDSNYINRYLTLNQFGSWTLPAGQTIARVSVDVFGAYGAAATGSVRLQVGGQTYTSSMSGGCSWLSSSVDITTLHPGGWAQADVDALTVGVARPSTSPAEVMYVDAVRIVVETAGACCTGASACTFTAQSQCSGTYLGDAIPCSPNPCPGACCVAGACSVTTSGGCSSGDWRGGQTCSTNPCPGACCGSQGSCAVTTPSGCSSGDWRGGQTCPPNPACPTTFQYVLYPRAVANSNVDGWNYESNFLGGSLCGSGAGSCYDPTLQLTCASSSPNGYTSFLDATTWSTWTLPSDQVITRVSVDVHGSFGGASGQYRLRVNQGTPSTFSRSGGCAWMPARWDITSRNAAWTKPLVDSLVIGVARASASTPTQPLYVDGVRLYVDTVSLVACCDLVHNTCSVISPLSCTSGYWRQGACTSTTCPPPQGACCAGGTCAITTLSSCLGTWTQSTCTTGLCTLRTCCSPNGACSLTLNASCGFQWGGSGTCTPNQCPGTLGACCTGTVCTTTTQPACAGQSWDSTGACTLCPPGTGADQPNSSCCNLDGTCYLSLPGLCNGNPQPGVCSIRCPTATGACSDTTGACTFGNYADCRASFQLNASCSQCPLTGACCAINGSCSPQTYAACTANPLNAFMNAGSVCTPSPCLVAYPVVVAFTGSGRGTIISTPAGIACGGSPCSVDFRVNTEIVLRATAAPGSQFMSWSGGDCTGTGECSTTVAGPLTISARFRCLQDFDDDGSLGVNDIFSFLGAWFGGDLRADADGSGAITVQDIFTFLSRWFGGC